MTIAVKRGIYLFSLGAMVIGLGSSAAGGGSDAGISGADDAVAVCKRKNDNLAREFAAVVEANAACAKAADCVLVPVYECPFGCYVAVAKVGVTKAETALADLSKRLDAGCGCVYRCLAPPRRASCVEGRCVTYERR